MLYEVVTVPKKKLQFEKQKVNEKPDCFDAFQDHILMIGCAV